MTWEPEPIGGHVRQELARFGPAGAMAELVAVWAEAVGPGIAANAWPARIARDGTLHVAASSSAWAFELTQLEATVRERLRERLRDEAPPRIRFAVGPIPERGVQEVKSFRAPVPKVTPDARSEGERIAAGIEDHELRALVARAAAASLAGQGANRPV